MSDLRWRYDVGQLASALERLVTSTSTFEASLPVMGSPRPRPASSVSTFSAGGDVEDITQPGRPGLVGAKGARWTAAGELRDGKIHNLPLRRAEDFAGIDVGTYDAGRETLVYSRCGGQYSCQLYRYRFDNERNAPLAGISEPGCDELGPSISHSTLAFHRGARTGKCDGGVFVQPFEQAPVKLSGRSGSTEVSGPLVAWEDGRGGLRVATVDRPTSIRRRVAPRRGSGQVGAPRLLNPVLDGRFLYFIEHYSDDRFRLARTTALRRGPIRRFRLSFTSKPRFTVDGGDLLYSGITDPRESSRRDMITRDSAPDFR